MNAKLANKKVAVILGFYNGNDFINAQTGYFANEQNLESKVLSLLNNEGAFSPREYILNNIWNNFVLLVLTYRKRH